IFSVRQDLLKRGGYAVRMEAWAFKRADILSDLFREFERNKVKVLKSEIKIDSQNVIRVVFDLSIRDRAHLERVSKVLEKTQNVIYAERI
ncbi:MAG: ACT domain-containing protein, partial [Candidatus Diapherotrites archaeon]